MAFHGAVGMIAGDLTLSTSRKGEWSLRRSGGPGRGVAHRGERMAVQRRRPVQAQRFQVIWRGVAFVARETVLRINAVPLFHASVPMRFRQDGGCSDRDTARIAFDQGLLLDQNIEPHGVENYGGSKNRTKQSTAASFIDARDARPAQFARRSLETGRAQSAH